MRPYMRRPAVVAVVAGVLVATISPSLAVRRPPRLAPPKPMVFLDQAGDANFLTTEGLGNSIPPMSQRTPVDRAEADVIRVTVSRVDDGRKVTGLRVRMTLSAPPGLHIAYFFAAATPRCSYVIFEYHVEVDGTGSSFLGNCPKSLESAAVKVVVDGNDVVWTLQLSTVTTAAGIALGSELTQVQAYTRNSGPVLVYPDYDHVLTSLTYVIGR